MTASFLMPAGARAGLDSSATTSPRVLLSIPTDVDRQGQPAAEFVIATDVGVSVFDTETRLQVPWDRIDDVRTLAGVGAGRLQIRSDDRWIDLVRFSNALATRFHQIARVLRQASTAKLVDHETFATCNLASLDPPRCESCDMRLPPGLMSCPRCLQQGRILGRLMELIAPYRNGAIVLCLLTLFGVAAELVPPKLQQYMVDDILMRGGEVKSAAEAVTDVRTALMVVVLALAASRLMLSVVAFIKGRIATVIGVGLTGRLRDELVTKLHALSVDYYDRHNAGSIISRVSHDSEALHGLMHQFTGGFLLQAVKLVGVGIMLVWINPKLAMYALIPVPLVLLGSWVFWNQVYPRYYRLWDASAKQMQALNGMLHGIRVVKAFGQEDSEFDRFQTSRKRLTQWRLWVDVTNSGYAASMQIVFSLGGLIVWYVGGRDVIGNDMTLGELIAFLAYLAMFYAPLNALSSFTTWMTSFLSGSKRVLELLDTPTTLGESSEAVPMPVAQGAIAFENVTFGYDPNQPVMKNVSFEVQPGEMIGIVGRSGSGKTTLVNLLTRFYDVQEGRVTIDGMDVRDIAAKDLRDNVGIVLQDSFLFRGTIYKNLKYGRPETSVREAFAAAKAAGAHDFICRQPLGYDTVLGQNGAGLSGGEKQRLSIARTLLYNPNVLILDEATSNIDAESEKMIQEAIQRLTAGRTTVAIAHRLSTLRNADRILVFDRGDLVEQGSHAELIDQDGRYARMVKIQMQVSKNPSVDRLMHDDTDRDVAVDDPSDEDSDSGESFQRKGVLNWLDPDTVSFRTDDDHSLAMTVDADGVQTEHHGLFCVRAFPARFPDQYISIRQWDESGDEIEIGILESLADLPSSARDVIESSLDQHYLIRRIERVKATRLKHGYLDLDVQTDAGDQTITMRWTASQAVDFGHDGKLIIDTDENRFVVPDVAALPKPDRERFQQYVYW